MQRDPLLIVNSFHWFVRAGTFPSGFRIAWNSGWSRKAKEGRCDFAFDHAWNHALPQARLPAAFCPALGAGRANLYRLMRLARATRWHGAA